LVLFRPIPFKEFPSAAPMVLCRRNGLGVWPVFAGPSPPFIELWRRIGAGLGPRSPLSKPFPDA
jgi:hypothetical protein